MPADPHYRLEREQGQGKNVYTERAAAGIRREARSEYNRSSRARASSFGKKSSRRARRREGIGKKTTPFSPVESLQRSILSLSLSCYYIPRARARISSGGGRARAAALLPRRAWVSARNRAPTTQARAVLPAFEASSISLSLGFAAALPALRLLGASLRAHEAKSYI